MQESRYPQPKIDPFGWINSSAYVRRIMAVYFTLPTVKRRARPVKQDFKTAIAWEASGLPLDLALYIMGRTCHHRLAKAPPAGPAIPIGSLNYFTPIIEDFASIDLPPGIGWADHRARVFSALATSGWVDPGTNWPGEKDSLTGRTWIEEKRYQKKIAHRATKWGLSPAEAEARIIERARARKPRQLRMPRGQRQSRSRVRARLAASVRAMLRAPEAK